ncbi:hypothetical protein AHF37_07991 [Paragonimus kellicotti]|nr:hypothetical protein AHF37_07991 [Paragonimus kellicotti]
MYALRVFRRRVQPAFTRFVFLSLIRGPRWIQKQALHHSCLSQALRTPVGGLWNILHNALHLGGEIATASSSGCFRNPHHSSIVDSLFDSVKQADSDLVDTNELLDLITKAGISLNDPRLSRFMENLKKMHGLQGGQKPAHRTHSLMLDREAFKTVAQENLQMLMRVVTNDFCIPDFQQFTSVIEELFRLCQDNENGKLASYIPQLERVDPKLWGLSVCTVDGQRVAQENLQMLMRVVTNDFCIPDFQQFTSVIEELFRLCQDNENGKLASYIPQLERVDPKLWGLSVCTVDGQR